MFCTVSLRRLICHAIVTCLLAAIGRAERPTVSIAAAANLTYALDALNGEFQREHPGVTVTAAYGASGNLLAQIEHGAPFDIFLSADAEFPQRLAAAGEGEASTRRTFALGRLVLWTTRADLNPADIRAVVLSDSVKKLAIAQPRTAPFGHAAQVALTRLKLWAAAQPKLVIGENISQTAQFVDTGNADAGFVAMSLVVATRVAHRGRWAEVPASLYAEAPLEQACILTKHGTGNDAARQYLAFLKTDAARQILDRFGYGVPVH